MSEEVLGKVPTTPEVRNRIDHSGDQDMRAALRAAYLMCARVSEVVGKATDADPSPARGPTGKDATDEFYDLDGRKDKALVINVKTAKRDGLIRRVGLPADSDEWVRPTASYFWARGSQIVFPFTRKDLWEYIRSNDVFEGYVWPVQKYYLMEAPAVRDSAGQIITKAEVRIVQDHLRPFTIHSLRDARATYLLMDRHFDGVELAIHGGWAINSAVAGVTPVMARYLDIYREWKRPFPKLLTSKT